MRGDKSTLDGFENTFRAPNSEARKTLAGIVAVVLNYVFAQGAGFLIQVLAMALVGPAVSGAYGLALLTINLTILLGDLGYGLHFLRDPRVGSEIWQEEWRTAQGHRLLFLLGATVVIAVTWPLVYGAGALSWIALVPALPSIPLSFFNFSSVLFAQGRVALGNAGRLVAAVPTLIVAVVVLLVLREDGRELVAFGLGAALTIGQTAQAAFHFFVTRRLRLHVGWPHTFVRYLFGRCTERTAMVQRRLLAISGRIWGILMVGTVHGAVPAFVVAVIWPSFLPYQLLLQTMLAGVAGIQDQALRALAPKVARQDRSIFAVSLPKISNDTSSAIALGIAGVGVAIVEWGPAQIGSHWGPYLAVLMLMLIEWISVNLTLSVVPVVLARHAESYMFRCMAMANGAAAILTVAIVGAGWMLHATATAISVMFVVRSVTALITAHLLWRHLDLGIVSVAKVLVFPLALLCLRSLVGMPLQPLAIALCVLSATILVLTGKKLLSLMKRRGTDMDEGDRAPSASTRFALEAWDHSCRLCHGSGEQTMIGRERLLDSNQFLYLCAHCGGLYLAPDFTPESLDDFYRGIYRQLIVFEASSRYDAEYFRRNLFAHYGEVRAAALEKQIPFGGSVFEMGSGCGAFLRALARRRPDLKLFATELDPNVRDALLDGTKVTFLDPPERREDLTAGIGKGSGPTAEELASAGPFDLVAAFHVLEHLRDPGDFLSAARRALKPGGQIVIEVPDADTDWCGWNFINPAHLSYFTVPSISRLAARSGLEVLECCRRPWGLEEPYLLMRATGAAHAVAVAPAPASETQALCEHARGYLAAWGLRAQIRNALKNLCVFLVGPSIVGMWPRSLFRRKMRPRFEKVLRSDETQQMPTSGH